MSKKELDNLVKIGKLKAEAASQNEFAGMLESARTRLTDAQNQSLDPDSQLDLAYGAAHRLALAALRHHGYRSADRITVFQTLVHTMGTGNTDIQTFLGAHNERNLAEYEGRMEIDEKLFDRADPLHEETGGSASKALCRLGLKNFANELSRRRTSRVAATPRQASGTSQPWYRTINPVRRWLISTWKLNRPSSVLS